MSEWLFYLARLVKRISRGAGTLPDCGPHPGLLLAVGLIVGAGICGGWGGFIVALVFVGPLFLAGCHERSVLQERLNEQRAGKLRAKAYLNTVYGPLGAQRTRCPGCDYTYGTHAPECPERLEKS